LHYRIWNCKKETNLRIGSGSLQIQVFLVWNGPVQFWKMV
jgi:hypothetical protein